MAKTACFFPSWTKTVHSMAREGGLVRVGCDTCRAYRDLDMAALASKVGPDYSLIDRRCKCRLTPGCQGWNRFFYSHGVMRPLWTEEQAVRWTLRG